MLWSNLDSITRRRLLEMGLPLHYYLEYLLHASTCLRELHIDTLKVVNYAELKLNDYFAADLPADFVDDVGVGIPVGQYLQPISKRDNITQLRNVNSAGAFVPFTDTNNTNGDTFFGFNGNWTWFWNVNDYGEPTGRMFGANGGANANGYQIFKQRRQIQFTETFTSENAVLMYISDGQRADNATQVDTLALKTIQTYQDWQTSPNFANKDAPEARTYYNERRRLVARLDELTVADIKQVLHRAYTATIKT
jgi:hypothetical protein